MKKFITVVSLVFLIGTISPLQTFAEELNQESSLLYIEPAPYTDIVRYYPTKRGNSVYASTVRDGYVYSGNITYVGKTSYGYMYSGRVYRTPAIHPVSIEVIK